MKGGPGALLLALIPCGCHSLQDLDVDYRDCVDVEQTTYREEFSDTDLESLRDRCWHIDNQGLTPQGITRKFFVEDGDFIIRVDNTDKTSDPDDWTATDQAPMFYRRLSGDFLVVVRVEAASQVGADHCIPPGNRAGLVARRSDDPSVWSTWTVQPYLWDHGGGDVALCDEDANENNNPTATVQVRSSQASFAEYDMDDVGADGEADIAICRIGSVVHYYYGQAGSPTKNIWLPSAMDVSHPLGSGPVDVGMTAAGTPPEVAGHFNWIVLQTGVYGDGCAGALESFTLPEDL
jgi:hypothetical protein